MNRPEASYSLRQFAGFLLWSMVIGAAVEYAAFCATTGIPFIWTATGLVCWGILNPNSEIGKRVALRKALRQ